MRPEGMCLWMAGVHGAKSFVASSFLDSVTAASSGRGKQRDT